MTTLSTHVLDSSIGRPAGGVRVVLLQGENEVGSAVTDEDGRIARIGPERLEEGEHTLIFEVGEYFTAAGRYGFYPRVVVVFTIADATQHHHVPVLLSPFGYSTYRGS